MSRPVLLCIDDRPQMLQLRKARLEALGYAAETATSALTAITMLEQTTVDAVLMEYKSEGMDAEAVAFLIKQRFPNQPVILLSAYSDVPERILWLMDEYLMRSDPLERLVQVIERVITRPAQKFPPRSEKVLRKAQAASLGENRD